MMLPESQREKDDFEKRRRKLLDECKLAPQVFDNVMARLEKFRKPFVERFVRSEQVSHANTFVQGLLSALKDKNLESIAYRFGQQRMPLQWFIGVSDWDHEVVQTDYYLSNAAVETELAEFARAAKAEHRIEECLQRGKSEAGLGDDEVRNWKGWHHLPILSLIASWLLVTEARRGKKMDRRDYGSASPRRHRIDTASRDRMRYQLSESPRTRTASTTQRTCSPLSLEAA